MLNKTFFIAAFFSIIINSNCFAASNNILSNTSNNENSKLSNPPTEYIILLILIACNNEITVSVSSQEEVNAPTRLKLYDANGTLLGDTEIENGKDQTVTFSGNFSGNFRVEALINDVVVSSKDGFVRH